VVFGVDRSAPRYLFERRDVISGLSRRKMMTESEGSIDFQLAGSLGSPVTPISGK
jgi:hypothetical protein